MVNKNDQEESKTKANEPEGLGAVGHSIGRFFRGEQDWQKATGHEVSSIVHADGKYHFIRAVALHTNNGGPSIEAGRLQVIDPHGVVKFDEQYTSGGKGNGAPRLADAHIANKTKDNTSEHNVKLMGGIVTVPVAIRLADKDTHQKGILIHEGGDLGHGCLHMHPNHVKQLASILDNIPAHQRPKVLEVQKDPNHADYEKAVAMLNTHGIHPTDSTQRTLIVAITKPQNQRGS